MPFKLVTFIHFSVCLVNLLPLRHMSALLFIYTCISVSLLYFYTVFLFLCELGALSKLQSSAV